MNCVKMEDSEKDSTNKDFKDNVDKNIFQNILDHSNTFNKFQDIENLLEEKLHHHEPEGKCNMEFFRGISQIQEDEGNHATSAYCFDSDDVSVGEGEWPVFPFDPEKWGDTTYAIPMTTRVEIAHQGILTQELISSGLSCLVQCPETRGYALAKLTLINKGISDISILENYKYLQHINLSHNKLTDLTALSGLRLLTFLDVSYNRLASLLDFQPPCNLTYANYSFNSVEQICDLTKFWSLVHLDLSHNNIRKITGLQNLRYLQTLDLSYNNIEMIENLNHLPIMVLLLQHNRISMFEEGKRRGMKTMLELACVDLSNNRLSSLALFQGVYSLRVAIISNNLVSDYWQLENLKSMMMLMNIDLRGNPITKLNNYRLVMAHTLPSIVNVDGIPVTVMEKVAAQNLFNPCSELKAAYNHALTCFYQNLPDNSVTYIGADISPLDGPPHPIVILVGPPASNKKYLAQLLTMKYPEKIWLGKSYTTRPPTRDETTSDPPYHFISQQEFANFVKAGKLLNVSQHFGYSYGFSCRELAEAVENRKLLLTSMDIVGALVLRMYGKQPHLVLTLPLDEKIHQQLCNQKYELLLDSSKSPSSCVLDGKSLDEENLKQSHSGRSLSKVLNTVDLHPSIKTILYNLKRPDLSHSDSNGYDNIFSSPSVTTTNLSVNNKYHLQKKYTIKPDLQIDSDENEDDKLKPKCKFSSTTYTKDDKKLPLIYKFFKLDKENIDFNIDKSEIIDIDDTSSQKSVSQKSHDSAEQYYESLSCFSTDSSQSLEDLLKKKTEKRYDQNNLTEEEKCLLKLNETNGMSKHKGNTYDKKEKNSEETFDAMWQEYMSSRRDCFDNISLISNTSSLDLDDVKEFYMKSATEERINYLNIHQQNPGLFSEIVDTSNIEKAMEKLVKFVKDVYICCPEIKPTYNLDNDCVYQEYVSTQINKFMEILQKHQSTMEQQKAGIPTL